MEQFAICAILKNEAPYLAEWIAFHLTVGFDHFILYDNGSTDGARAVVEALPFADRITLIDWPERPGQVSAYQHFFDNFRWKFDWIAYIDLDEFIHPLHADDIRAVAAVAGDHAAILINWLVFGPNGAATDPPGLVIDRFTQRLPEQASINRHVKSLVRCSRQTLGAGPHTTDLSGDACNARGVTVENVPIGAVACHDNVVINHYYTKSRPEWCRKVGRGRAMVPDTGEQRDLGWFAYYESHATVTDMRMLRWTERLRSRLRQKESAGA